MKRHLSGGSALCLQQAFNAAERLGRQQDVAAKVQTSAGTWSIIMTPPRYFTV
jgi:hypothetical protein